MTEEELINLSEDRPIPKEPFETVLCYGMGKWLKKYVNYPEELPLCVEVQHGVVVGNRSFVSELKANAPLMLFYSHEMTETWKKETNKPCVVMGSPFVYYRMLNGIKKDNDAKGTLVFPWHSTKLIDSDFNWKAYCDKLMVLPDEYKPITICLHWVDIMKGRYRMFMDYGYPVVTAGHVYDEDFTERFYSILRKHKYSTSNALQSCTFYSIEMGIPFFLYGEDTEVKHINRGDPNIPLGVFQFYKISKYRKKASQLFSGYFLEITKEQKNYCEIKLGIHDALRPDKLRKLLWLAYYQYNSKRNKRAILINLFRLNENSKGNNYKGDLITDKVLIFRSSSIERFNSVIEWVIDNMKPDEVTAVLQKDIIDRIRKDYINRVIQIEPGKIEWKLYRKILDKNIARDDKFDLIFPCTDNYSINYSNLLYIAFKLKAKKIVFKSEDKILIMFKEELFYRLLKIAIVNIVHVILDKFGGYSLINYISKKRLINLAEENIK